MLCLKTRLKLLYLLFYSMLSYTVYVMPCICNSDFENSILLRFGRFYYYSNITFDTNIVIELLET